MSKASHWLVRVAPYIAATGKTGRFNLDGSVRWSRSKAKAIYASNNGLTTLDVNQDGVIQMPERSVPVVSLANAKPVDYRKSYFTWSVGANYEIQTDVALFARVSRGARFNANRVLFGGGVREDGSIADALAVNFVNQQEAGIKFRSGGFFANLTAFRATTAESNELVIPVHRTINNKYRSYGLELEGGLDYGVFHLTGGATYTHARIVDSQVTPALNGYIPYRQADLIFQASPQVAIDGFRLGASFIGTTFSYASDVNELKMPGYVLTGAFASYAITPALQLSVNAQNLFNVLAITELGIWSDTLPTNGTNAARAFPGRNFSATIAPPARSSLWCDARLGGAVDAGGGGGAGRRGGADRPVRRPGAEAHRRRSRPGGRGESRRSLLYRFPYRARCRTRRNARSGATAGAPDHRPAISRSGRQ
ncbi:MULTISPECIES: TonB-dependent receptor [unclassified Sphingomonas]|jgi:outer membrane receptor protein involved in Fe transport|uniref:TonB-dependent receptor n=2 Tax=Bacteria TaxID=2 RepID=UPI000E108C9C|nr:MULTISPECIES: TonB-dependent receptor [unclassified Sphingomonas]AXJ96136.1 hypothetical protein DM480_12125 [Sphingomonas sp. FARSPH]